jgi:hypothetical protein
VERGAVNAASASGRRRRQITALVLAGVFPGLGQFYNRQPLKGGAFLVVAALLSWVIGREVPEDLLALAEPHASLVLALLILLVLWVWSIVDAWVVAGRPR